MQFKATKSWYQLGLANYLFWNQYFWHLVWWTSQQIFPKIYTFIFTICLCCVHGFLEFYLFPGSLSDFWGRLFSDLFVQRLNAHILGRGKKNCVCQNRQPNCWEKVFPRLLQFFRVFCLFCFGFPPPRFRLHHSLGSNLTDINKRELRTRWNNRIWNRPKRNSKCSIVAI